MTTVTAVRGTTPDLRRAGDALPHASIGTVPILWYDAGAEVGPWAAPAILDEIARLGYEGTQLGADFPTGETLRVELSRRDLRLAEVYVPIPTTVDGPTTGAMAVAVECLTRLHEAGGDVLCVAVDGSADRDAQGGRAGDPGTPALTDAGWEALIDLLHAVADAADGARPPDGVPSARRDLRRDARRDRPAAAIDGSGARRALPRHRASPGRRWRPGRGPAGARRAGPPRAPQGRRSGCPGGSARGSLRRHG